MADGTLVPASMGSLTIQHVARVLTIPLLTIPLMIPSSVRGQVTDGSTLAIDRGAGVLASQTPSAALANDPFTGSATFQYPIRVPPGTGGMQPSLALVYSSRHRADSWVGYGWNLGLSRIERSLKRGVPQYNDNADVFTLDGQELVPEDTNTALPRRYHTKRESFLRVIHEADDTWTVTEKNGTQLRFGTTIDSIVENGSGSPFQWLLREREDPHGNAFIVTHDRRDAGVAYPALIRYTWRRGASGLASLNPANPDSVDRVVRFVLEARPDHSLHYSAGLAQELKNRLAQIDVEVAGSLVRRYTFDYGLPSSDSQRSLLRSISEFGSDAAAQSPTAPHVTQFSYGSNVQDATEGWQSVTWPAPSAVGFVLSSSLKDGGTRLADMDGDGCPDLYHAVSTQNQSGAFDTNSGVYLNTCNPQSPGFSTSKASGWPFPELSWFVDNRPGVDGLSNGMNLVDFNGDGRADLVQLLQLYFGTLEGEYWQRQLRNTGGGWITVIDNGLGPSRPFGASASTAIRPISGSESVPGSAWFAELNGDGNLDLVVRHRDLFPNGMGHLWNYVAINRGDGLGFDFHGNFDGTVDDMGDSWEICFEENTQQNNFDWTRCLLSFVVSSVEYGQFSPFKLVQFAGKRSFDVNGDGLDDHVSAFDTGQAGYPELEQTRNVFLNIGINLVEDNRWSLPVPEFFDLQGGGAFPPTRDQGIREIDLNGDGHVDLIKMKGGTARKLWLGTGNPNAPWLAQPSSSPWLDLPSSMNFVNDNGTDRGVRFGDLNGDGMVDLIRKVGSQAEVHLNRGSVPDLLVGITNPLGGTTAITYVPSTTFDNTGGDGLPDLPQVLQLVDSIQIDTDANPANGGVATTQFSYEGGFYDAEEREFRGFAKVVATEVEIGRSRVTLFHQDDARVGLPFDESVAVGTEKWSQVQTTYTPDTDGPPYESLPKITDVFEWDGTAQARRSRTELFWDSPYGTLGARREYGEWNGADVNPGDTRSVSFLYSRNIDDWLVDRLALRLVFDGHQLTGTLVGETQFFYDGATSYLPPGGPPVGDLTRKVEALNDPTKPNPATALGYDGYGNLTSVVNPRSFHGEIDGWTAGNPTLEIDYDPIFHTFPVETRDALGHRTVFDYAYDPACTGPAPASVPHPAGAGLVHVEQGPNDLVAGQRWLRCYDAFGRMVLEAAPASLAVRLWQYTDTPGSVMVTSSELVTALSTRDTTSFLDGLGRLDRQTQTGPQGRSAVQIDRVFDAAGRVAQERYPYFEGDVPPPYATTEYDPLDRVSKKTLPGTGRVHDFNYARGVATHTRPNGSAGPVVTKRTFDPFGNVVEVEEVGGPYVTSYRYGPRNELERVTDHHGNVTEIQYDFLGRKTLLDDADTGITSYDYDSNGNLIGRTIPLGTVTWTYDALDRPIRQHEPGTLIRWSYDTRPNGIGLLDRRDDRAVIYEPLDYDLLGRPLHERYKTRTTNLLFTFENTYNLLGQPTTREYPTGRVVQWVRDGGGFLTGLRAGSGPDAEDYATGVAWDAQGRVLSWTSGAGVETTYGYDPQTFRLASFAVSGLENRQYFFYPDDRLQSIQGSPGPTRNFVYDPLGRLSSATGPYGTNQTSLTRYYGYDPIGNLTCMDATSLSGCVGGTSFTYPPAGGNVTRPHAPTTVVGPLWNDSVQYDGAGNLTDVGNRRYHYPLGQLQSIEEGGATVRSFVYEASGRLARIADSSVSPTVTHYLVADDFEWGFNQNLARTHVGLAGVPIATHEEPYTPPADNGPPGCAFVVPAVPTEAGGSILDLLVPSLLVASLLWLRAWARRQPRGRRLRPIVALGTAGSFFVVIVLPAPLGPGVPEARAVSPAGVTYYHGDHLASSVVVTGANGALLDRRVYRPFGEVQPATAGGATEAPRFGFTGQRYVAGTGIYHYGARFYDPTLGRFLQPDSIVPSPTNPQSLNRYSYVLNDPISRIDPTGRASINVTGYGGQIDSSGRFTGFIGSYGYYDGGENDSYIGRSSFSASVQVGGVPIASLAVSQQFGTSIVTTGAGSLFGAGGFSVSADKPVLAQGYADLLLELPSITISAFSLYGNVRDENYREAFFDALSIGGDALLAVVPFAPGGIGLARQAARGGRSLDDLSQAAGAADRNGLTRAGRALQKHGDRPGSAFPDVSGHGNLNATGQNIVDDILTTPGSAPNPNRFGGVDIIAPDGRGVRYDADGGFMGFLEPPR